MVERNAGVSPEKRIEFRVGVHVGDVVEEADGDLMGDCVNIAARLEGVAKPGGVCLSEQAFWQIRGRLETAVVDLGTMRLKNIAEPIRIFSLAVAQVALAKPAPSAPDRREPPRLSLVVLPFANIGGDPEQEYFVDGVTESLTTDLSRIRGAFVIARNTAFTYKGMAAEVKQIGCELNVEEALRWLRKSIDANPNNPWSNFYLSACLVHLDRFDEARAVVRTGLAVNPKFSIKRLRAFGESDNDVFLAQRERMIEAMRTAEVPDG
jgi:hypothetical protein